MVYFMVNYDGIKAFKDAVKRFAPFIQTGDSQVMGAYRFGIEARKVEVAVEISLFVL
jgi:hypothetical protein